LLGRGRKIAHLPWSGQATHAVAGQLERVVRPHSRLAELHLDSERWILRVLNARLTATEPKKPKANMLRPLANKLEIGADKMVVTANSDSAIADTAAAAASPVRVRRDACQARKIKTPASSVPRRKTRGGRSKKSMAAPTTASANVEPYETDSIARYRVWISSARVEGV
jgi:hypothetical protein